MTRPRLWALVPAAGAGRRLGADIPKQYLPLGSRLVIERTLDLLVGHPLIQRVYVALDPADPHWSGTAYANDRRVRRVDGGTERCHSVRLALEALAGEADPLDWVLVHDAARPCLCREDLDGLIDTLLDDPVGGLLAVPVHDTMKRAGSEGRVQTTVERADLWRAYTPQMFRLGPLLDALVQAIAVGANVTDESSALERMGLRPQLVQGRADNLKITSAEDLPLALYYLERQGRLL